jgi:hypothetical protein
MNRIRKELWILIALLTVAAALAGCKGPPPTNPRVIAREPNVLLWGDTHVHSSLSADAPGSVDVNTTYNWAKGLPVVHPQTHARIQLERPLDFLVVTDHAEGLKDAAWNGIVDAAERHYAPCAFTTFIGWEWSSELGGKNLHRVVLMNEGGDKARQILPFSSLEGPRPEALWSWLEETASRVGTDFIAIPHSPNSSGGAMYPEVDSDGQPLSSTYAKARMRWEPLAEVTQVEGDFETNPSLSPDDEFADFERARDGSGEYARSALLRGVQNGQSVGVNPFQFGMLGSTGAHTGLASADEEFFYGAIGAGSGDASAQGLTAVWAEENTRTSIFDALKRKEVYATTGPRIRLRFFGGWNFKAKQASAAMVMVGYLLGHPMGSELTKAPEDKAPSFLMYAVKDPEGANLDRIQLIKGWVDAEGTTHERVYDVVWSAGRERGTDGKVPPVENTVDVETAKYENTVGAAALHGFWSDPDFDPDQRAFYYVRVLQIPTPRHTLYDAVAGGTDPAETGHPPTIQERAYSSPIWYAPSDN